MLGNERDLLEQRVDARTGELKHSLSLLSASLESTFDGILIEDGQGEIVRWNQKFARMWKMPEAVLSGLDVEKAKRHILAQLVDPESFEAKIKMLHDHPEQTSFDQIELSSGRKHVEDALRLLSSRLLTSQNRARVRGVLVRVGFGGRLKFSVSNVTVMLNRGL
jgi:PAS domain-containing protein